MNEEIARDPKRGDVVGREHEARRMVHVHSQRREAPVVGKLNLEPTCSLESASLRE